MFRRDTFRLLTIAGLAAAWAAPAAAQNVALRSHSVTYAIAGGPSTAKDVRIEGTASATITRICQGWEVGFGVAYGIERGVTAVKQVGVTRNADRFEEKFGLRESEDGRSATFTSSYRRNSHLTSTRGDIRLDATEDGGTLTARTGQLTTEVRVPKSALLPIQLREALVDRLLKNDRTPWSDWSVELSRFHVATDLKIELILPPQTSPFAPLKAAPYDPSGLLKGRSWVLRQTSLTHKDWLDAVFVLHESGAISRMLTKREGQVLIWTATELTAFPPPRCD